MCIWIDKEFDKKMHRYFIKIGISCIDILTGKNYTFQYETEFIDTPNTFDETDRIISTHNPNQVVIITNLPISYNNKLVNYLNLSNTKLDIHNSMTRI